jgi:hypothetical protein
MLVVRPGSDRVSKETTTMGTHDVPGSGSTSTLGDEVCDKCGSRMHRQIEAYDFERWECPKCRQVIGIDRDPEVGGRFQISRGQPWHYSPDAFKTN